MPIKLTKAESETIHTIQRKLYSGRVSYLELRYCKFLKRRADAYYEVQQDMDSKYFDSIGEDDSPALPA
jgi:hypothetical protein